MGVEEECKRIRQIIRNRMLSSTFPEGLFDKFKNVSINELKKGSIPNNYYSSKWLDVLNSNDILEIYQSLLSADISKCDSSLFLCTANQNKSFFTRMGESIVNARKNNVLQINQEKDLKILKSQIDMICGFGDIPNDLEKSLNDIKQKIDGKCNSKVKSR